jgi:hypothetical protein
MYLAKVNGQRIDFNNPAITIRLKNPMFDSNNGMEWTASFPFKLPATSRNKQVFGFPNRLTTLNSVAIDATFEHYFNGVRLPGDTIRIRQASDREFEAYIKVGRSDFISLNKTKKLRDLTYPDMSMNYLTIIGSMSSGYPMFPVAFPMVHNEGFFDGTDQEYFWKDISQNTYGTYQNCFYHTSNNWYYNHMAITPFPYVAGVIEKIFSESNYLLTRNPFTEDPDLQTLCIYNSARARFGFLPTNFYFNIKDHLPDISVQEFLLAMRVPFGADLYFDHYKREVKILTRQEILNSSGIVDMGKNVSRTYKVLYDEPFDSYRFTLTSDSSDAYWRDKVADFNSFKNNPIIVGEYFSDLPASPEVYTLGFVKVEDQWYIYSWDDDSQTVCWHFLSRNVIDLVEGENDSFRMEGKVGLLVSENHVHANLLWSWICPFTKQPGWHQGSPMTWKTAPTPFAFRMLFFKGLSLATNNYQYPLGTSYCGPLPQLPFQDAKYTLQWLGPNQPSAHPEFGLYENFWKDWLDWKKQTRQVEFSKLFSPAELVALDFSNKHRAYGVNMLLDEVTFTVTKNAIKPAKVKGWTV